jgi:hypothetical protein
MKSALCYNFRISKRFPHDFSNAFFSRSVRLNRLSEKEICRVSILRKDMFSAPSNSIPYDAVDCHGNVGIPYVCVLIQGADPDLRRTVSVVIPAAEHLQKELHNGLFQRL